MHVPYRMQLEISSKFPHSAKSWRASALLYKHVFMTVCYIKDLFLLLPPLLDVVNSTEHGKSQGAEQEQKREVCSFGFLGAWAWQVRGPSRRRCGGSISYDAAPNPSCPQHCPSGNSLSCLLQRRPRVIISVFQRDAQASHSKTLLRPLPSAFRAQPRAGMLSEPGCSQHGGHCLGA